MLDQKLQRQDEEVGEALVQPVEDVSELGEGAPTVVLHIQGAVRAAPRFAVAVRAAVRPQPSGLPGGGIFSGLSPRRRAQLDANVLSTLAPTVFRSLRGLGARAGRGPVALALPAGADTRTGLHGPARKAGRSEREGRRARNPEKGT